uniref:CPG4 domain-containing protein n=1 Tax=Panagrellus redivivus TaxID=6233 RepID=A0A7E4ZVS1_PANRE
MKFVTVIALVFGVGLTYAAPATSDAKTSPCLQACVEAVAKHQREFSLLRVADLSHYFKNHDHACTVIDTAKKCVEACGSTEEKNPFALKSLTAHCGEESEPHVEKMKECINKSETSIHDECEKECGNHKGAYDEIKTLSAAMDASGHSPEKLHEIIVKTDTACHIFKCMTRCNVNVVRRVCGKETADGLQGLIQLALNAQRRDLDAQNLTMRMAATTPPKCNYMFLPKVMFDRENDKTLHSEDFRLKSRIEQLEAEKIVLVEKLNKLEHH